MSYEFPPSFPFTVEQVNDVTRGLTSSFAVEQKQEWLSTGFDRMWQLDPDGGLITTAVCIQLLKTAIMVLGGSTEPWGVVVDVDGEQVAPEDVDDPAVRAGVAAARFLAVYHNGDVAMLMTLLATEVDKRDNEERQMLVCAMLDVLRIACLQRTAEGLGYDLG